jgi:hypothetical protein
MAAGGDLHSEANPAAEQRQPSPIRRDLHRLGGGSIENLRLKAKEAMLEPPGISVLKAESAAEAARQVRLALPRARRLHEAAHIIGSTTEEFVRGVGFDVMSVPSATFPNHHRIVHPEGAAGFSDENLARLASVFEDARVDES